jgi:hypothetical protein
MHALFLLGELRSSRSLPTVLRFLSQDEASLELWLGDVLFEEAFCAIAGCVGEQFDEILAFLVERSASAAARGAVCRALVSETWNDARRRDSVVAVVRAYLAEVCTRADRDGLDDNDEATLMDVVLCCAHGGLKELEEPIVAMIRSEVIPPYFMSVADDLDMRPRAPLSSGIFDVYARIRLWPSWDDGIDIDSLDDVGDVGDVSDRVAAPFQAAHDFPGCGCGDPYHHHHHAEEPFRRAAPKVGRNEPCPCGSGKKYKRCCGV